MKEFPYIFVRYQLFIFWLPCALIASFSGAYLTVYHGFNPLFSFFLGLLIFLLLSYGTLFCIVNWSQKRHKEKTPFLPAETDEEFCSFFPESQRKVALAYRIKSATDSKLNPHLIRHDQRIEISGKIFMMVYTGNRFFLNGLMIPSDLEDPSNTSSQYPFESLGLTTGSPWFLEQYDRLCTLSPCYLPRFLNFFI
ncbi:MAG: hypothetical protein PVH19_12705, partial [Planctomycetia bacterium]